MFEYNFKGMTLTMSDMCQINEFYEAACTAEYVLDLYTDAVKTKEDALEIGYEVRRLMNKYDYDEEEAISEVLAEREVTEEKAGEAEAKI